jgi:hypothetical protein
VQDFHLHLAKQLRSSHSPISLSNLKEEAHVNRIKLKIADLSTLTYTKHNLLVANIKGTSVNLVHNAPVPLPLVTYFGPEATFPLHGCWECFPELLARRHPKIK